MDMLVRDWVSLGQKRGWNRSMERLEGRGWIEGRWWMEGGQCIDYVFPKWEVVGVCRGQSFQWNKSWGK